MQESRQKGEQGRQLLSSVDLINFLRKMLARCMAELIDMHEARASGGHFVNLL